MRTLEALLKEGTEILEKSGNQEARLDAWLLLEYASGKSRAYYYAHPDEEAKESVCRNYQELCRKRAEHIPLQHLTHQAFFMGHEFFVNEHVLVPRQDTETLVEETIALMKGRNHPEILDMCTGSGCILISLLLEFPNGRGTGADISPEALLVAERNADSLGVSGRTSFVRSDLFESNYFQKKDGKETRKYDILISNPPYIPTAEIDSLMEEVRLHDPRIALDGREDGLYFYRMITEKAGSYLKPAGWLLFEIGCGQGSLVSAMMRETGFSHVSVKQDLAGLDRVVMGQKKEGLFPEEEREQQEEYHV